MILLATLAIALVVTGTYISTGYYESFSTLDTEKYNDNIERIRDIEHLQELLKDSKPYFDSFINQDIQIEPGVIWREAGVMDAEMGATTLEEALTLSSGASKGQSVDYGSPDQRYSSTNVQVQNVDEPDYIKNDGRYVYIVTRNILSIIDAYPADTAKVIFKTALDIDGNYVKDIFLNGDRLVMFYEDERADHVILEYDYLPTERYVEATRVLLIDVTVKERPAILNNYLVDGYLMDSRMIQDHVYFVTSIHIDRQDPKFPAIFSGSDIVDISDAFYFKEQDVLSGFTILAAIDLAKDTIDSQSFLLGDTSTFYVSQDNFYLTYQQYVQPTEKTEEQRFFDVVVPLLPESVQIQIRAILNDTQLDRDERWSKIASAMQDSYNKMSPNDREVLFEKIRVAISEYENGATRDLLKTIIHKIELDGSNISYIAKGQVPGRLLNQFSMDEHQDRFRVATTTERQTTDGRFEQANAVYVMDEQLEIVGKLEQIAKDESIFSARFMGDRLYLVTFLQIDPFFVIDLTNDTPKILGELKIPGYSNYLHPYDRDHVIGVGRDSTINQFGGTEILGVKLALFDVSNVTSPKVLDDIVIGNRYAESVAEHDHKAFFFDGSRGILSIPITLPISEITTTDSKDMWSGFFVYKLDKTEGFEEKAKIHHPAKDQYIRDPRTFYIQDVLYTASYEYLKMNSIDSLDEINSIKLQNTGAFVSIIE